MLPAIIKPFLWSYDFEALDPEKHKRMIVGQLLNFGTKEATDWLFSYYGKKTIADVAANIPLGSWNKKSLALWKLVLDINPIKRSEKLQ
jgi:hypothetical protein